MKEKQPKIYTAHKNFDGGDAFMDLEEYLENETIKLCGFKDIIFKQPRPHPEIQLPDDFVLSRAYPQLSFSAGPVIFSCCVSLSVAELTLNFYRLYDFLKYHKLNLNDLPYDTPVIRKFNLFLNPRYPLWFFFVREAYFRYDDAEEPKEFQLARENSKQLIPRMSKLLHDPKITGEIFVKYGYSKWKDDQQIILNLDPRQSKTQDSDQDADEYLEPDSLVLKAEA